MTLSLRVRVIILAALLLLSACKIELHNGLSEEDANQMLALLLLNKIDAEKLTGKAADVKLMVEQDQFANAVEVLRQNGLPRIKVKTMQDLFPSGQLVSSPFEEQAKISYLKEQQLEKMLNSMNGVIRAEVSVVQGTEDNSRGNSDPNEKKPSASIYIKYSPQVNLLERESSIRDLVLRAVPNLKPESISVVMEAADIRFIKAEPNLSATSNTTTSNNTSNNTSNTSSNTKETLSLNPPAISDLAPWFIAFALGMGILWAYWIYLQRRRQVKS